MSDRGLPSGSPGSGRGRWGSRTTLARSGVRMQGVHAWGLPGHAVPWSVTVLAMLTTLAACAGTAVARTADLENDLHLLGRSGMFLSAKGNRVFPAEG